MVSRVLTTGQKKGATTMTKIIETIENSTITRYGFESRITRIVFRATETARKMIKRG